ncbi:MAG: gamma-glutamyl-gamma-aminobutyrate hydrolase family protein [Woeseia sp.]
MTKSPRTSRRPGAPARGTVLAIAHLNAWAENRILARIRSEGFAVEVCCIERGDAVPVAAGAYAGILIGGGLTPIAEAAQHPFMQRELDLVRDALAQNVPYLGICLGAQLLAAALGEIARPAENDASEIGYHAIEPLDRVMEGLRFVFQWHWEGVALPRGATLLATGKTFTTQAFRVGANAYGIQFHPCVGPQELEGWIASFPSERLGGDRGALLQQQRALAARHDPSVEAWLERFLPPWLGIPAAGSAHC